ncbi:HNH endonuclease signature motif containing protein [uncultured Brachyspira sp.]|uniref:HNH endonuclease signature motif containing protein n=1 Tax=uncultured Brachyspira sp. TaxID=221953 RepID=UPI00262A2FE8|nr:HNH endonuclease signature motif containing protein [uncultured Brachyspira sp.]
MAISESTKKLLLLNSGGMCAICRTSLTNNENIVADVAHIIAQNINGPRGNIYYRDSIDIDGYDNLILLCPTHHRIIDNDVNTYTVEKLKEIKYSHEEWVKNIPNNNCKKNILENEDIEKLNIFLKHFSKFFYCILNDYTEIAYQIHSDAFREMEFLADYTYYQQFRVYDRNINILQDNIYNNTKEVFNIFEIDLYDGNDIGIIFRHDNKKNICVNQKKDEIKPFLDNIIKNYLEIKKILEY